MKKVRSCLCILFLSLLCWFGMATMVEAATPYSTNGRLSVKSGKIVNSKGKTFVIKGVSTHGIAWYPEYINKETFRELRDKWGVNTIRLVLYTSEYNGYCAGGNTTQLKKYVNKGVEYATDLGMYVIIDWHILSDGNPLTFKSQANSFFRYMANKYKNYKNVIYEICNEPNGSGGSWKNIKSYAKTIIKTIRTYDKKAIIVVGTPTWSQDVEKAMADPITGYSNIAYSFHFYAGTHQSSMRKKLENVLKKKFPVIVTEFGISDASGNGGVNTKQGDQWMTLLDKYKVGRVCWNLSNKNESCSLLKSSCTKLKGWTNADLSASGKWLVKAYTGKTLGSTATTKSTTATTSKTTTTKATTTATSKTTTTKVTTTTTSTTEKTAVSTVNVKLKATIKKVNSWKSGDWYYNHYTVTLNNTKGKASSNWTVKATFRYDVSLSDCWCGEFTVNKKVLSIKPMTWNKKIALGASTEVGFIVKSKKSQDVTKLVVTAK